MPAPKAKPQPRFEDTLNELEQLLTNMESGELSLDESLAAFEQGIKLTRSAQKSLEAAQQKVQLLIEDNDGELHTETINPEGDTA